MNEKNSDITVVSSKFQHSHKMRTMKLHEDKMGRTTLKIKWLIYNVKDRLRGQSDFVMC